MSESKPEYAAPNWTHLAAIVYQPAKDATGNDADRFEFAVSSRNDLLKPGEAQQIASMIVREHNSHEALVEALRRSRDWMKEPMGGGLLHERFDDKKTCEADCLRCAVNAALALAEKES